MRVALRTWDGANAAGLAESLRSRTRAGSAGLAEAVAATLAEVASGGDAAAIELGERFDGVRVEELRVPDEVLDRALDSLDPDLRDALEEAAANITTVASAQVSDEPSSVELPQGHRVEVAEVPVQAAGIYAPGGRAPYPSTVLMGVIPARVAGVERVVVASPPAADGLPHAAVLAAARIAEADEVFAIGGAQAVAALAYGTESIAAVDVIAGPGSPYVQEAKVQLASVVGIDGYAGPSELAVISDSSGATAETVALDL
ncbi:MAG: histidinol dehydrogenase, partial [Solirubrobacterales bacterium]